MTDDVQARLDGAFMKLINGPLTLDKAIAIALVAHAGQEDKGQNSYIRHPLRVMEQMDAEDEMIVAVCHDVVEDSKGFISFDDLSKLGFTLNQVKALDALTKREGESYEDRMTRVERSYCAKKIKIRDIKDNLEWWRLKNLNFAAPDVERIQKYVLALKRLGALDRKELRS